MKRPTNIEHAMERLHVTTRAALDERILEAAMAAYDRARSGASQADRSGLWRVMLSRRAVKVAAMVAVAATIVVLGFLLSGKAGRDTGPMGREPSAPVAPNAPSETLASEKLLAAERQKIEAVYAAGDVEGLLGMLGEARLENKIVAADYLGEIGDQRAVAVLSELAEQWRGQSAGQAFLKAIERINSRTRSQEPNVPDADRQPGSKGMGERTPGPILSGTVTDVETNAPIEGVLLRVSRSGGGRVYEATSDSNGVYAFDAVGSDGAYNVFLNAPEHVAPANWEQPRESIELRRSHPVVKDFALAKGATIVATVVNEAGQPVRRASMFVAYVSDEWGKGPKESIRSNDDGIASLGGLRADEYWVTVTHRDYAFAGQHVVSEEPGQVESLVFVLEKGIDIIGVATCSDGLPASGWEIEPRPKWWHSIYCPYDYPVADDGSFVLEHIVAGQYRLGIQIPVDGGSRGICSIDVNLPPETDVLDLRIPKPSPHGRVCITGTVTIAGGSYDRGFWIHARSDAGHSGSTYLERGKREFVLDDLVPDLYDIDITVAGDRHEFTNVKAPGEGVVLEIAIHQAVPLRAKVVDKQTREPVTRFQHRRAGERNWCEIDDPNGLFEIAGRGPDLVNVTIRADGYGDKMARLSPDANEVTVIEMTPPLALAGVVVNEAGRPLEGATVSYRYRRSADESPEGKEITATGADGRFTVDDVPASDTYHWFVFRHRDYARSMKKIRFADGGVTQTQVILPGGGTVEGYVYDWRGAPLPETPVYFMDESDFSYWKQNRARLGKVTTDKSGYYRIDHLPEELCYALRDDPDNQLGVVLNGILPRAGQTVRFDLGGPWKASGRLLARGEPMANTKLLVTFEAGIAQGFEAYALSDSLGRFRFSGLPTGRRRVYCALPGGHGSGRWIELGAFDFAAGSDLELGDFDVTTAQVTIALAADDPEFSLDSWDVTIIEYDEKHFWGRRAGQPRPRSDDRDPFVFSYVSAGRYEAIARKEGFPSVRQVFEVEPGQQEHAMVLTIPAGSASISGTLVRPSSERSFSSLVLRSEDQRITAALRPDSDGAFAAQNLPAGDYVIGRASVALARSSTLTAFSLKPGQRKDIRIQLDPDDSGHAGNAYLIVLVVSETGIPLATPDVWLERGGQVIEPHFNTDDGKSFMGVTGTYTLHARYPGYAPLRQDVELISIQQWRMQEVHAPLVIRMRPE